MTVERTNLVLPGHINLLGDRGVPEATRASITLDISRTAFLIVDIYGIMRSSDATRADEAAPSFGCASDFQRDVVFERIIPAREAARALGIPIVYCTNSAPHLALDRYSFWVQRTRNSGLTAADLFRTPLTDPREYEVGDCPTIRMDPDAAPRLDDVVVRKIVYSGFVDTYLDTLLRNLEARWLIVCGFSATECLLATVIDAMNRGYEVIILRDATTGAELPEDRRVGRSFSDYIVGWMQTYVGSGVDTIDFLHACQALHVEHVVPEGGMSKS